MKSLREAHEALDRWFEEGTVGNIIFYRPPGGSEVDCILEQTIKTREMDEATAASFEVMVKRLGAEKGSFWTNRDGEADRVTITKEY